MTHENMCGVLQNVVNGHFKITPSEELRYSSQLALKLLNEYSNSATPKRMAYWTLLN
jgi:hypothetical protein